MVVVSLVKKKTAAEPAWPVPGNYTRGASFADVWRAGNGETMRQIAARQDYQRQ